MNAIQQEWEKMRIAYQIRYARMYKKVKEDKSNTDNHRALLEMSYVLITVFGLTDKQVQEIERNGGLTDQDLKEWLYIKKFKDDIAWGRDALDSLIDFEISAQEELLNNLKEWWNLNYKLLAQKYIKYGIEWLEGKFDTYKGMTTIIETEEDLNEEQLKRLCMEIQNDSRVKIAAIVCVYEYTITIIFNK